MESVNLFEAPLILLKKEAKRRKWILFGLFTAWFSSMGLILGLTYSLEQAQERKLLEIQAQSEALKPRILHYQAQYDEDVRRSLSKCTAYRLKALFAMPIKGLYLSSLNADGLWTINGTAESPRVLDLYREQVIQQLDNTEWEERFTEGVLNFEVQGELAC